MTVGEEVNVGRGVFVGVEVVVGVNVAIAQAGAESELPIESFVRPYSSYILTWATPGNCLRDSDKGPTRLYSPPLVPQ